ncbi:hypothetical protein EYF80_054724 [Liparis tanakae]|uniref:Uncharacterized protein n=1 Tax=Liparis tanakae TaxID=230148 RepID=A0A4Z2F1U1_9TELE|nr:hypothetical protein EYF80_054724 [Liparis tanakae]
MWRSQAPPLQQDAVLLLGGGLRVEEGPHGLGEHLLDAVLVERRALQVAHGLDLAGEGGALVVGDGRLVLLLQLPLGLAVVPEVALRADQEDGDAGAVEVDQTSVWMSGPQTSKSESPMLCSGTQGHIQVTKATSKPLRPHSSHLGHIQVTYATS